MIVALEFVSTVRRTVGIASLSILAVAVASPVRAQVVSSPAVVERPLYFKLPLAQPVFHWRFHEPDVYLSGRLTLTLRGADNVQTVTVFDDGVISDGWAVIQSRPAPGMYFGFKSTARYLTAPTDAVEIELVAVRPLVGAGPELVGFLPPGTYRSSGKYKGLIGASGDEGAIAFVNCWDNKWELERLADGSLSPEEVERRARRNADLEEQAQTLRDMSVAMGARNVPEFDAAADGRPCG